jgi:rhodanese-related sulfurtransferase
VTFPLDDLARLSSKLNPDLPTITVCSTGYRSSTAVGILERAGFSKLSVLEGGGGAWSEAELPLVLAQGSPSPAGAADYSGLNLPERIDPSALYRTITDLPDSIELVDIRPQAQAADYPIPGARHVALANLLSDESFKGAGRPLVIVDRDGSLAMIAAGYLARDSKRSIRVLHGGVQAYFTRVLSGQGPAAPALPSQLPQASPAGKPGAGSTAPSAPVKPAGTAPKRKSAGC